MSDLDAAMQNWTDAMSVGPFLELPPISPDRYLYCGQDVRPHMRVGLARPKLGLMLEIIIDSPIIHAIYGAVRRASENWDGHDPVRPLVL